MRIEILVEEALDDEELLALTFRCTRSTLDLPLGLLGVALALFLFVWHKLTSVEVPVLFNVVSEVALDEVDVVAYEVRLIVHLVVLLPRHARQQELLHLPQDIFALQNRCLDLLVAFEVVVKLYKLLAKDVDLLHVGQFFECVHVFLQVVVELELRRRHFEG